MLCPPFDAAAVAGRDMHTGGPLLSPVEVTGSVLRLIEITTSPPPLLLACGASPLLGLLLLLPLYWLLYLMTLPLLPWWILAAWLANGKQSKLVGQ